MPAPIMGHQGFVQFGRVGATNPDPAAPAQADDAIRVMCRPGARFVRPRNPDIPYPIALGHWGPYHVAEGLRNWQLVLPVIPMRYNTPAGMNTWFRSDVLSTWFINRSPRPWYDTYSLGTVFYTDAQGWHNDAPQNGNTWALDAAKMAGFTLSVAKGQPIGFTMRMVGSSLREMGKTVAGAANATDGAPPLENSGPSPLQGTPLSFADVRFGGALASAYCPGIFSATLEFDGNLTPNMELDGTAYPKEYNADIPNATLTIQMYAQQNEDGTPVTPPGLKNLSDKTSSVALYPDDPAAAAATTFDGAPNTGAIIINNGNADVVFYCSRLYLVNPEDRQQQAGRVVRTYTYRCLAWYNSAATGGARGYFPLEIGSSDHLKPTATA